MLVYHHSMPLEKVLFDELRPKRAYSDHGFREEYNWLEKEVGFYPLFLAVGETEEDIRMTGYSNQWARVIGSEPADRTFNGEYISKNILRKKSEFPNYVLFSFEAVDGVFMDYVDWHLVLNSSHKNYQMTDYEKKLIFKYSWSKSKWLNYARKKPHCVQLVAEMLNLPEAKRVRVRNKQTKKQLEYMGFENVEVRRVLLGKY